MNITKTAEQAYQEKIDSKVTKITDKVMRYVARKEAMRCPHCKSFFVHRCINNNGTIFDYFLPFYEDYVHKAYDMHKIRKNRIPCYYSCVCLKCKTEWNTVEFIPSIGEIKKLYNRRFNWKYDVLDNYI